MKALSIRQPWAWLICAGYKDIENRNWHLRMPPLLNYPQQTKCIYVHAGKTIDGPGIESAFQILKRLYGFYKADEILDRQAPRPDRLGAIIGEVDIVGCTDHSLSPWFVGPYGFIIHNPKLYDKPIPCKGKLGFFEPECFKVLPNRGEK